MIHPHMAFTEKDLQRFGPAAQEQIRRELARREAEDRLRRLGMNRVPDTENVWQSKTYFAKIRENR